MLRLEHFLVILSLERFMPLELAVLPRTVYGYHTCRYGIQLSYYIKIGVHIEKSKENIRNNADVLKLTEVRIDSMNLNLK